MRAWLRDDRRWFCLLVALMFGLEVALLCSWVYARPMGASDFAFSFGGAQALLHGINPWHNPAFAPGNPYPYNEVLLYPMPPLIFLLPLAWLSLRTAGVIFFGSSTALLCYAVMRTNRARMPLFMSPSFLVAASLGQWTPLVLAAMLLPSLYFLTWLKPTDGAMAFLARPQLKAAIPAAVLCLVGLLLVPTWPFDWLQALAQNHHPFPLTVAGAPLLLLAALCWRRPEARLLLGMALVPHLIFWYDGLLAWFIPRTMRQSLVLVATSWVAFLMWYSATSGTMVRIVDGMARQDVVAGIYLPALGILLWQERVALLARARRLPLPLPGSRHAPVVE